MSFALRHPVGAPMVSIILCPPLEGVGRTAACMATREESGKTLEEEAAGQGSTDSVGVYSTGVRWEEGY